nr:MAG TPA: hypothetical protein [Caudoviricetes sp.]
MSSIRRPLSCFLCCLLLLVLLCPSASAASDESTKPTDPVNALQFCELYTLRRSAVASLANISDEDYYVYCTHWFSNSFSCTAGILTLDTDTLDIRTLTMTLIDLKSKSDAESDVDYLSAVASVSALEQGFDLGRSDFYSSGIIDAMDIISDILDKLNTDSFMSALADERILVYSGNYDYYLWYVDEDDEYNGHKYVVHEISLIAEAR